MPKLPMNYENACIYEIVCKDVNITERYVGSTTNLIQRRREHKSRCNNNNCNHYNQYVYQFIRENGEWENWDVVLIERVIDCKDKEHLHKRERFYIEEKKAELNKKIPLRSCKEYYDENKEKINEKHEKYRKENKDKIHEKNKEYYESNKEKKKAYCEENKDKISEKSKEYYEKNKEKTLKKAKEYYENNKNIIVVKVKEYSEKNKEKIAKKKKEYCEKNKDEINERRRINRENKKLIKTY
jgi:hypothetical protein